MNYQEFLKECKENEKYEMFVDKTAWDELVERFEIENIEHGLCFGNTIVNRMIKQAFLDMKVPSIYSHMIVDHCYTLTGAYGRQYCVINPYYGPDNKDKLMQLVKKSLNKTFESGIKEAESNRQFDNIYVWDTGLYNPNDTIGIFIAENPILFEFKNRLSNICEMIADIDEYKLNKNDQVKHKKALYELRNLEALVDTNWPVLQSIPFDN